MTFASILLALKNLPAEVDSKVAMVSQELTNVEQSATPVVDIAKQVFPQAAALGEKYAALIEEELNNLVKDLPPEAQQYINKYLLPVEKDLP